MAEATGVDSYLEALPEGQRATLQHLRETIRAAAPEATEAVSYQMPAFRAHGRVLVYYAAFRDHYSLFPASMTVFDAFREDVGPYYNGKGTLRFSWDEAVPVDLVTRIVAARLAENAVRGRR